MLFFCISSRSWNAINLERVRKETWKIHRARGRRWQGSSAARELQADDWQLLLPTRAELFRSHWSLPRWGTVLPMAPVPQRLHFPQRCKERSSGQAASAARAAEREEAAVLLHRNAKAEPQGLRRNLQPHPEVFFLNLINHENNLNSATFLP